MKRGVLAIVVAALALPAAADGARPLQTAIIDPAVLASADLGPGLSRIRSAGATAVRIPVNWYAIAPAGRVRPEAFVATSPRDRLYRWEKLDQQLQGAVARGLDPILSLVGSPEWATVAPAAGAEKTLPDPVEYGRFALAAARRYSGSFEGLPRARYWQVWNEPNLTTYFRPQLLNGEPFSPGWYRRMVNEVTAAVKAVRPDNLVVAGGTAPFRDMTPDVQRERPRWGPLTFMRELLCLDSRLRRKCNARVRFDVWAHHPYTTGTPTQSAVLPDDVSLGDLGKMRQVLQAGVRAGTVASRGALRFWVTEFSWDSNPPDRYGVPLRLHARWTAEALYRMWTHGVSLVTWYLLRDEPLGNGFFAQSGLYLRGSRFAADRPKPALQAFRFPFVAFPQPAQKRIFVWGRTPSGRRTNVLVEQEFRGGWRRLGVVRTNVHGIFQARFATRSAGFVRGRTLDRGEQAVPFSLAKPPDRRFYPFGEYPFPR